MSKIIFELSINLIETLICVDFVTRYLGRKYEDWRGTVGFIITWFVAFAEVNIINYITFFETVGSYIPCVIYFIYAAIFTKGSILQKVWVAVLTQSLVTMIAVVTNLFVCVVTGYDPYRMITVFNITRVVSVVFTKIVLFFGTRLMLKYKYSGEIERKSLIMLIAIPLLSIISLSNLMLSAFQYEQTRVSLLIGMSAVVMSNIFAYYMFVKLNRDYEKQLSDEVFKKQYKQQIISQAEHLDEILLMQRELKSFRHDFQNHLIALTGYLANSSSNEGIEYINQIRNQVSHDNFADTGNIALDAIVGCKKAVAQSKGIEFVSNIQVPERLGIDASDVCVIFGNALDNAIEACEKTQYDKKINVSVIYDNAQLICKISNTALPVIGDLKTTKADKDSHGFGIENIKFSLSKYKNILKIEHTDKEFVLSFIIFDV